MTTLRVSQLLAEVLMSGGPNRRLRVSQLLAEILLPNIEVSVPAIFPTLIGLGYDVVRRPLFNVDVATAASGREVRQSYYSVNLWEWDLTFDVLPDKASPSDFRTLLAFFLAAGGNAGSFLFQDPDDNYVQGQPIATTDGATSNWLIGRNYDGASSGTPFEPIGYIGFGGSAPPVNVYLANQLQTSGVGLDQSQPGNQRVGFSSPPAAGQLLTMDFSYYFLVRFADAKLDFTKFMNQLWSVKKLTLHSVRN